MAQHAHLGTAGSAAGHDETMRFGQWFVRLA
jgi:hypothetical protein